MLLSELTHCWYCCQSQSQQRTIYQVFALPNFFLSSKMYIMISFMHETRNINDCSDTWLHSWGFFLRGNSEWWALKVQRGQNPHYLVLCMKKKASLFKTREEVKLPMNHLITWILVILWLDLPLPALSCSFSKDGEMGSMTGLMGLLLVCTSVASLLEGLKCLSPLSDTGVFFSSICAEYLHENFLQTSRLNPAVSLETPRRWECWTPQVSLTWHSNQPQMTEWVGGTALHISFAGSIYPAMSVHDLRIMKTHSCVSKVG